MDDYAALRGRLGMGGRVKEGRGIFDSVGSRARGRARYTAAIDRAGHDSEHNTGND
ncbi:MAG TPA: hypothetical protein VHZ03_29970 [Trebonia sp.]|jgi:hypothetical protein|nr:hypothetical protein [Trebonia sp.]